jgi:branched-subunit amino acid transport protein
VTADAGLGAAVAGLAAVTFAFRMAGPLLRRRLAGVARYRPLVDRAVAVVFAALVATSALLEGHHLVGVARPAAIAVAGVLAWRGRPFVVVVLAAAGVAAALRLLGVP